MPHLSDEEYAEYEELKAARKPVDDSANRDRAVAMAEIVTPSGAPRYINDPQYQAALRDSNTQEELDAVQQEWREKHEEALEQLTAASRKSDEELIAIAGSAEYVIAVQNARTQDELDEVQRIFGMVDA